MNKVGVAGRSPEEQADREARWGAYLEEYKKTNPEKFAQKAAEKDVFDHNGKKVGTIPGDFDKIPDSFQ